MSQILNGKISRVADDIGIAYVVCESLNKQFVFSYNKIAGYAGQYAKEIGLKKGCYVSFTMEDDIVKTVTID